MKIAHVSSLVTEKIMLPVRLFIAALTLILAVLLAFTRDIGPIEAIVVVCPLIYLILDVRDELQEIRKLELQASALSSQE